MCLPTRARFRLKALRLIGKGALDGEELFTIEGSENWRSTPDDLEEREKWPKKAEKPTHRRHNRHCWKLHSSHCAYPSLLHNKNVPRQHDELNLRHLYCWRDPNWSLHDRSDVHNRKKIICGTSENLHNRDIGHLDKEQHNNRRANNLVQELDEPNTTTRTTGSSTTKNSS